MNRPGFLGGSILCEEDGDDGTTGCIRMNSGNGQCGWCTSGERERGVAEGGLQAVADQLGINRETLRRWVIEQDVETGERLGLTQAERSRIREPERENRELKRANEILKTAAAFFGAELDRQHKK